MANVKNNSASQETRRRLLLAAGEIFADRGFQAATIKEITDLAGANIASVNYHFQDKAELYAAVLRRLAEETAEIVPPDDQLKGDAGTRLRQFICYFCNALMGRQRPTWEQVLMAREMAEPSTALVPLYEHVTLPLGKKLSALIAEILQVPPNHPAVGLAAASVVGQCVYYIRHKNVFGRIHTQLGDFPDPNMLARHIADFSLAGLHAQRRQLEKGAGVTKAQPLTAGR